MSETEGNWRANLSPGGARPIESGRSAADVRQDTLAARDADVLVDLSFWSLIRVAGADAQSFLQGQLSNDIRAVTAERSQLSAWCTPKGRMLAIFRAFRRGEDYFLQLPASLRSDVIRRLRMFVLRAKVVVESAAEELVRFGLSGPNAPKTLAAAGQAVPEYVNGVNQSNGLTILSLPGPQPRYELIVPAGEAARLWEGLASATRPVGPEAWAWLNIQAGLPEIFPATVEEFVPQMANLDLLDGVSFSKGCYPGQEIVARVKYLGRIKQRMFPAWTGGDDCPAAGSAIVAAHGDDQAVGRVVDGRPAPAGGCDLLVVLGLEYRNHDLRLGMPSGAPLALRPSPFKLEQDS